MAYITQVGTTTTANTSLTPNAVLVHTQTNTTRIRKLWVNIFADQVKGGGDYVANVRVQRAGAGSEYVSIKTTLALAAGVLSGYFGSIPVTLNATDVMKVYLLGTAADSDNTADIIVDVNEEWLNIDASGRVDLGAILGTALTETVPGYLSLAFKKLFDVVTPVLTSASVNQTGDTFAKFAGITLLANWLRGFARKDAMDATAKTELNTGGGTYNETTDSLEGQTVDLTPVLNRLPAALVGGRMDSSTGDIQTAALAQVFIVDTGQTGAGAVAGSVVHEIADAVLAIGIVFPAGSRDWQIVVNGPSGPESDVEVEISINQTMLPVYWRGYTNAFGIAQDVLLRNPQLDPGNYWVKGSKGGFTDGPYMIIVT